MKIIIVALTLLINSQVVFSQLSSSINIFSSYDDNLYRSPDPQADMLSAVDLSIAYSLKNSDMRFFLSPSFFSYKSNVNRNFILNQLGFGNRIFLNEDKSYSFYFGAQWDLRLNGELYDYYDYNQLYAYSNLNLMFHQFMLKFGYNYRYRGYSHLPDLTNNRHYGFVQINKSFPTKTTLILESDVGYKSFSGQDYYSSNTASGGGWGMGRSGSEEVTVSSSTIPSLTQAVFLARVSQSLHPTIGLYVQYRKQISLNQGSSFTNSDNYYQDEELFDDPFSYNSDAVAAQLTWMMPWKTRLRLGGTGTAKEYISENAYISAEDTLAAGGIRKDDQSSYYVNFSKNFLVKQNWLQMLNLELNYAFIRNTSNSYWYDYKNSVLSAGIKWHF